MAVASGRVLLGRAAFELVAANAIKKGDVLTVAQASVFTSILISFRRRHGVYVTSIRR